MTLMTKEFNDTNLINAFNGVIGGFECQRTL